jgi:putative transposase
MTYPLVRELAGDGIPVTVTCRVLKIARQPYYRGLACPVSDAELDEAYVANAVFDAHRDDPEFGYRFLADEVRQAGHQVCDRTVWRICRDNGWWSVSGKPRSRRTTKAGTPAHDDVVRRDFTAGARTGCGSRTSPSTPPARASSICAPSRTCTRTGSSAGPSTGG